MTSVIGSIGGRGIEDREGIVARLIALPPMPMAHGERFTGRPTTRIHADDDWVLKYRAERRFGSEELAARWAEQRLRKEREAGVFHPDRTWLVLRSPDGKGHLAANLSPRLEPLHILDWSSEPAPIALLAAVARLYYRYFELSQERLDEGLSNFARDRDGKVYYIDDDFYSWDEHHSFASMVARWLREFSATWLDERLCRTLGEEIGRVLVRLPRIEIDLFEQAMRDVFLGTGLYGHRERLVEGLVSVRLGRRPRAGGSGPESGWRPDSTAPAPALDWNAPIAVIADVHGNLPALERVMRDAADRGIRQWLCLGDVVGYGPFPKACVQWMMAHAVVCIRGNHDHFVAHGHGKVAMSQTARITAEWSRERLDGPELDWLGNLPLKLTLPPWLAVHGSPMDRSHFNGYVYETTWERNLDVLRETRTPYCLHGHSHLQGIWAERTDGEREREPNPGRYDLRRWSVALLNPGAVGQTRNRRPGAQYAVLDPAERSIELIALDYDMTPVIEAIRREGLPESLVDRLIRGV